MINNNKKYYSEEEFSNSTRTLSLMSALLFLAFSVIDIWAIPSVLAEVLIVRLGVVAMLLFAYVLTFSPLFYKYKDIIMAGMILVASFGIEHMIFIASPSDYAYSVYFVGIVLILMTLYSWTYINILIAVSITLFIIAGYIYIELFTRPVTFMLSVPELVINLFFISTAVVIGIVARSMRDSYMHKNYLLQQSLKEALEDKTVEADDYAYKANHDALTLLPNRRHVTELLEESLQIAKEKNKILAILFFDLNGFKQINDIFGHAVGDEVLVIVAKRLELAVRKGDCISRLGGDEYLVGLMMDAEHASEVNTMAAKFTAIISEPMNIDGNIVNVGAAVGIAAYPLHGNKIGVLIDIADKKMYNIKQGLERVAKERDAKESAAITIFPGNSKNRR